ncbi:MAG: hypothetical protein PHP97_04165 [Candidatus Shapirobacteria bacterium]|nr:hypothetical protein [Candidatus Shapirobacteria bacterium]MDD3002259.1 hypothetical protein [Candidatus Shapirobacteria bacterium]MDD4382736.1 hypothetical protein [Candidatus Shapirobacteria bacterium]
MNQVINDFKKGFKQLGQETVEKLVEETGKIAESVITAKELLGDIKPLSDEELAQKKGEDEKKKQEEMSRLRQGFGGQAGRSVENEMEKIRHQKEKEDEEKGNIELENLKRQKEMERQDQMVNLELMQPSKHHKDKGGNKRKTQQPDHTQMSQTSEYKGKIT